MKQSLSRLVRTWMFVGGLAAFGLASWNATAGAQDPPEEANEGEAPAAASAAAADSAHAPTPPEPTGEKVDDQAGAKPVQDGPGEDAPVDRPENRKGEVQEIGVVITSIAKIDVIKEAFEYDALVTMGTKGKLRDCEMDVVQDMFPDGLLKKVDEVDAWEDGDKKYRQCKVTVEEQTSIDVSRYPFDSHSLRITVGDEGDAIDGVEFKPMDDKELIGVDGTVTVAGWEFGEVTSHQERVKQARAKGDLTRAVFDIEVSRPTFQSFLKGFLGVCFQLVIALVALVLAVKAAPNRIALVTGALIAVSTAHNQVSSQIGVTYLTTADKFFFVSYFLLLANVVFTALMVRAEDKKDDAKVKLVYRLAWYVLPALTLVLTTLVLTGVV